MKRKLARVYVWSIHAYCHACGDQLFDAAGFEITNFGLEEGMDCPNCGKFNAWPDWVHRHGA